jgi:aerobic-type carbon monoxide dehydrogenase small subunit (CoxS/CutS family)
MSGHEDIDLALTLNGEQRCEAVDPRMLLLEALRDRFGAKGPKYGCGTGDCGACTIELDGRVAKSCLSLAVAAEGAEIVTIEGLSDGDLSPLQRAFCEEYGFQCGFCLSGMLFAARDLLAQSTDPSDEDIRQAISGNLCRCTGYEQIVGAVRAAAGS